MKRTCEKLCGHLTTDAKALVTKLRTLEDGHNSLAIAEAALKLRDAIAAVRQATNFIDQAKAQRAEAGAVQGRLDSDDDAA
jgi:flagellin-like hook-associated protein FlgL